MGKLALLGSLIVRVNANDHLPAHFHAVGPDQEVLIGIPGLGVIAGRLRPADARKVMAWATANLSALRAEWNRVNPRFPV